MTELAKQQYIIMMRSGIEKRIDIKTTQRLQKVLQKLETHMFVVIDDELQETVNTADITGIFAPQTVEAHLRRKRGQWQASDGSWHDRGEKYDAPSADEKIIIKKREDAIKNCGKCISGWIKHDDKKTMFPCRCLKNL